MKSTTKPTTQQAEQAVKTLLEYIGENPEREGLIETPKRVINSYSEFFKGYHQDPEKILSKTFDSDSGRKPAGSERLQETQGQDLFHWNATAKQSRWIPSGG